MGNVQGRNGEQVFNDNDRENIVDNQGRNLSQRRNENDSSNEQTESVLGFIDLLIDVLFWIIVCVNFSLVWIGSLSVQDAIFGFIVCWITANILTVVLELWSR